MEELELLIMSHGPDPAGDLQPLLDQFTAEHHCHVKLRVVAWETAWTELVRIALYGAGPDVSEVGMNWVGNLVAMNALRPFRRVELASVGGPSAFLASAWQSGRVIDDERFWAIPWLADTRVLYYRRDLLTQAGINEQSAFQSTHQLEQTLDRLQASGVATPWVVPTQYGRNTLHNVASWVWGAQGDFISADGRRTLFNQTRARAGIRTYLGLHRYLSLEARNLDARQSENLYLQGKAAVTICGPWLILRNLQHPPFAQVIADTGTALPPGVPYVGGSNWIIWKHTRKEDLAAELVRFLVGQPVQRRYWLRTGLLPVRLDVLNAPPFVDEPHCRVMGEGLRTGRSFPSFSAWGLIEDNLTAELARLWSAVLADQSLDLDRAIAEHLGQLAARLDITLSQS